ncbi:5-bromo-4-chloroindolyl phosphate hydrolysis family protein [Caldibacillus lycopersici]|uniref:5-bromo-4-chloroindolyl phosphate hydrolysis family protein n=1 Tax=Perspicuibacillus lycopersici TaxID=1325689 RepID=A0AAE3IV02_9BACI|nr:5-bromo-4-chloroindolyl phosphate hydrolysis family protein [Perspicuibacillus lycopersici]MCU9615140.1 5-bromo-4-chloroindolyl phosphate hydrolysis family protein [Perspicuibacillus lycopersici]
MKGFLQFVLRSIVATIGMVVIWLIAFFGNDQPYLESCLFALIGGAIIYYVIKAITHVSFIKRNGLTRSEYRLVRENLKAAKEKIQRLHKAYFRISSLTNAKQNFETMRIVNKIYAITKKEPRRFFQAEEFFYNHLDSLVELSEKNAFLASQPAKTAELHEYIKDTQLTMKKLTDTIKGDLYRMLENDIDTLQFELDVAKQSIKKRNNK